MHIPSFVKSFNIYTTHSPETKLRVDVHTDDQRETIIPRHNRVAEYKAGEPGVSSYN